MHRLHVRTLISATLLAAALVGPATAQKAYPERPVTAIVGYLPGGAADTVMRRLAALMAPKFPAGLVVDNKPGAGGSVAVAMLSTAKPDGYQFAFVPNSNLALSPQVNKLSYKSPDDIQPVISVVDFSPVMLVPDNAPYKSLQDLLDAARAAPGTVSIGFPGITTVSHLNLLELEKTAGVQFIPVPLRGWGEGGPQLLGGHISAAIAQPIEAVSYLQSGKMRALGQFSETRQTGLEHVLTMKEQGQAVHFGVRYVIIVPNGTPADRVQYIHDAAKAAIETPEFQKFAADNALTVSYQDGETARTAAWADTTRCCNRAAFF